MIYSEYIRHAQNKENTQRFKLMFSRLYEKKKDLLINIGVAVEVVFILADNTFFITAAWW